MATGYLLVDSPNPTTAQGGYPRRGGYRPSGTCIVHTSEGNWTGGVDALTRLVQTRADHGCYHRACDWQDIARYYPWEWETWQDTETNPWAVGIAAACRTTDWGTMPGDVRDGFYRNMARMAADFVVYMRNTYNVEVPRRRISGAEARAGVPGFAAHGDSGVARTDPGVLFDWALFFRYINEALAGTLASQGTITEDPMEPSTMFKSKDGANVTLETLLNSIDAKAEHAAESTKALPWFDKQVRERLALDAELAAAAAAQIAALTEAVTALAAPRVDVDGDAILARIEEGMDKFRDSYTVTLERVSATTDEEAPA